MITIYKNNELGLVTLDEPTAGCWINVINPTHEELARLEKFNIPLDYMTYALDLDERPRTERENGDMLIILRIPFYQGRGADIPFTTLPLGIIFTPDHLVTVCKMENEILSDFASGKIRSLSTSKRQRFVLRLLLLTANRYLSHLREITKVVDALEDQLQLSTRNKEVLELLKYQKSLTYFTTALKSNELMMERLDRIRIFQAYPEDEDLLDDVLTENQQAIEMTNITSNILSSMMDAFASIISNNLNGVMKILAALTIIVALPGTVGTFFGMNVPLPLSDTNPYSFLWILAISLSLSAIATYIFHRRDWF